ncbi:MAG: hypothetical protein Q8P67_28030 [archaeon]|nr:hypothetical protein [archaeon]
MMSAHQQPCLDCASCTALSKQKAALASQLRSQQMWLNRVQSEFLNQQSLVEHQKARFQENNAQILKSNIRLQAQLDAALTEKERLRDLNERAKDRLSVIQRTLETTQAELRVIKHEYRWWKEQLGHLVVTRTPLSPLPTSLSSSSPSSSPLIFPSVVLSTESFPIDPALLSPALGSWPIPLAESSGEAFDRLAPASPPEPMEAITPRQLSRFDGESLRENQSLRASSRRASMSVLSYAEPKLNTKLRRGAAPGYKVIESAPTGGMAVGLPLPLQLGGGGMRSPEENLH